MNYIEIAKILNLNIERDIEAAKILNELIEKSIDDFNKKFDLEILEKLIKNKAVIVFGAGPSLKKDMEKIKAKNLWKKCTLIAADGAVKALIEENIIPKINVTDLDGDINSILKANSYGTVTLIHAHGDNISKIKNYFPEFKNIIFGTTQINEKQTKNFKNIYNFGGFTDGDRCVFLAKHFNAKTIALAGMDFGNVIGEYSGNYDFEFKMKKMEIAKKLLEDAACECEIFNLTSGGEKLKNIEKITIEEFEKMI